MAVVAHRNAQNERGDIGWFDPVPRAVIPAAHIPVVVLVYPVKAIVKEIIHSELRGIVNGVTRNNGEAGICGQVEAEVDANADTDFGVNQGCRAERQ